MREYLESIRFQSPRGDFGFLKANVTADTDTAIVSISIPSRGFWFFEVLQKFGVREYLESIRFQSPRGDFGFLKGTTGDERPILSGAYIFQSPRGDFGFLKLLFAMRVLDKETYLFQSPRGDFGFLKLLSEEVLAFDLETQVSIPSRGFWFFEGEVQHKTSKAVYAIGFNPLAGILVF